jgi:hyperosmotically inducible periplasmic protein
MWTQGQRLAAGGVLGLVMLMLLGCGVMFGRQSPDGAVSDSAITTKVKTNLLADPMVGALAIDVHTTDGVVSLNGVVSSGQERQRVVQIAQGVEGVKRVDARNLIIRR